jgi:hypothetical protein
MHISNKIYPLLLSLLFLSFQVNGQNNGIFAGGLETNANFFLRDSLIGADNIPQYDHLLFGADAWLNMNYQIGTWNMGVRFDAFQNSNLRDPNAAYTDQGIRYWFIQKQIRDLEITAGHMYDQIGSGIIFRSYEERALFIDNSFYGLRLRYKLNDNWTIKAMTGKQKNLFETYPGVLKGGSIEGYLSIGEKNPFTLAPGIGLMNRTLAEETMADVVNILKTYIGDDRVVPTYNTYAATLYSTMSYGPWSMYVEGAFKSPEVFNDPSALRTTLSGDKVPGKYVKQTGTVLYSSLSYSGKGIGISGEIKRTENFEYRTSPTLSLTNGLINFIPPMNRVNTYRLTARYSPATQLLSELAYQLDLRYSINKELSVNINFSNITDLNHNLLYRELYTEFLLKQKRKWRLVAGLQWQNYNQQVYEVVPEAPMVQTITPFFDFQYTLNRKQTIRLEGQYLISEQDYGSWLFGLVEYTFAPKWGFELSGMYNVSPTGKAPKDSNGEAIRVLYPTAGITFRNGSNRFALRYVKQVEGIICSGGVCRLEPAFSGFKFTVNSSF